MTLNNKCDIICLKGGGIMIWEEMSYNKINFPFILQNKKEETEYTVEVEEDI